MADTDLVQPLDPNAPAPAPQANPQDVAPAEPEAQAAAAPGLPKDLIKIPAMQALIAGAPPALSASIKDFSKRGEAKVIAEHKGELEKAGFGFYRSISGHIGVLFNMLHIHPQDIQAADKAGKLQVIAPPFDVVNHAVSKSGHTNPVLTRQGVPQGPAAPTPQAAPQLTAGMAPGTAPAPAAPVTPAGRQGLSGGAQRALMAARIGSLAPGAPTSGPAPGAGRLLNSILRPVV